MLGRAVTIGLGRWHCNLPTCELSMCSRLSDSSICSVTDGIRQTSATVIRPDQLTAHVFMQHDGRCKHVRKPASDKRWRCNVMFMSTGGQSCQFSLTVRRRFEGCEPELRSRRWQSIIHSRQNMSIRKGLLNYGSCSGNVGEHRPSVPELGARKYRQGKDERGHTTMEKGSSCR
jgi:hypothetical protein